MNFRLEKLYWRSTKWSTYYILLRRKTSLMLEAAGGIEPPNKGFADLCLTAWLRRRIGEVRTERFYQRRGGGASEEHVSSGLRKDSKALRTRCG